MRFGTLYEHQYPRPWTVDGERRLFQDALDQVELADRLGVDYVWSNEHHFLEEYSHSSAPEVFLAAASQRSKKIRLGHAVVLMPPAYNAPARIAERIATLDLISNGRMEFGTGESSSLAELAGFGIPVEAKREMWAEATEQVADMMALDPYPGYVGKYFSMPCRNVVPKPMQRPHPPLWLACSNRDSIKRAAKLGMGALTFAFVSPDEARMWVQDYYNIIKTECVPIGHTVNANIAMVTGFGCHQDAEVARKRAEEGFLFFGYSLAHHYIFGLHKPGRTDVWDLFQQSRSRLPESHSPGIGSPDQVRNHLKTFEDAGVDQVIFLQQGGKNLHEHICESLELFGTRVMPEFLERAANQEKIKAKDLARYVDQALERKIRRPAMRDEDIPVIEALGRKIAEQGGDQRIQPANAQGTASGGIPIPLTDPLAERR